MKVVDMTGNRSRETDRLQSTVTTEYCAQLQRWMWQCYWGNVSRQSSAALSAFSCLPPPHTSAQTPAAPASSSDSGREMFDLRNWYGQPPFGPPTSSPPRPGGAPTDARSAQQQSGAPPQAGAVLVDPVTLTKITMSKLNNLN